MVVKLWFREAIHTETRFCVNAHFCIVLVDRPVSENALFWNQVSGKKIIIICVDEPWGLVHTSQNNLLPIFQPIVGTWNSPKMEKKRRRMPIKLARCNKQTVDGETEHNEKKTKMASARKPESFVWTDNEVELLLRLTLDNKASKLQETRTQALVRHCCCCCYEMSRGQRSKARCRGVGRWRHCFGKCEDLLSTQKHKDCFFRFFHPETRFQKSAFSGVAFIGSMWMIGQNDAKHAFPLKSVSVWTGPYGTGPWNSGLTVLNNSHTRTQSLKACSSPPVS